MIEHVQIKILIASGVYYIICFLHFGVSCLPISLCTGLVQKAKKAKDKLLKRDGEDRPDTGSYESFYYGGVDPYMWEPQELGETIILFPESLVNLLFLDKFRYLS